jgi:hypothetical protein
MDFVHFAYVTKQKKINNKGCEDREQLMEVPHNDYSTHLLEERLQRNDRELPAVTLQEKKQSGGKEGFLAVPVQASQPSLYPLQLSLAVER